MKDNSFPNNESLQNQKNNGDKKNEFKLPEDQISPEAKLINESENLDDSIFDSSANQPSFPAEPQGEYISQELKNVPQTDGLPPSKKPFQKIPKIKLPKKIIFAIFGLVLLIIITLVISKLKSNNVGPLVGNKGEIIWWGVTLEEDVVNPLIDKFEEENPELKVTYVKQSLQDYRERLTNALASGNGPDIFEMHVSWVPMFASSLSTMPTSLMGKDEYLKTFYTAAYSSLNTNSGIVGMPLEYDALTLYINEDIFASAALKPPTTWEELRSIALKLTQKDKNKIILQSGVGIGTVENLDYWPEIIALMMKQNGANLVKPEGTKARDALSFFVQFSEEDEIWDDTMPPSTYAFATNKLAMLFAPARAASEIRETNPNLRYKTVPLPQLAKEDPSDPDVSYATFWVQSVWNRSSSSQSAWNLLKYLTSPESLQEMNLIRRSKNLFEKAYPRPDMAILQSNDSILGSIISLGNNSLAWYLASNTNDGETGLNSQIIRLYKNAIIKSRDRGKYAEAIEILGGVKDILTKYGVK